MNRTAPHTTEVPSMHNIKTKKRVHARPQIAIKRDFIVQTPGHLIDTAIANKLTSVEWSLWMYLMRINPFADVAADGEPVYRDIPSPAELALILGRDSKTIERAATRLEGLGLYKIRTKSWEGFNSTAAESKELLAQRKHQKSSNGLPSPKQEPGLVNPNQDKLVLDGTNLSQNGTKQSHNGLPSPKQEPESLHGEDFALPQTVQSIQINSNTTDNGVSVLEKFHEKLKQNGIYPLIWCNEQLIENPKMKPILQMVAKVPPDHAERAILAFLQYARSTEVKQPYSALLDALRKGWDKRE